MCRHKWESFPSERFLGGVRYCTLCGAIGYYSQGRTWIKREGQTDFYRIKHEIQEALNERRQSSRNS
jgi:hypothetical protein